MSARASSRLPAPWGGAIDRERFLQFRFEGDEYPAHEGDTIASALAASGQWTISRSFKYHRPRGILTMAGQDANTLVQVGSEPNVRADLRLVTDGMEVSAQNTVGSLRDDRAALLDRLSRFLPVGFYYRTFFGPGRAAWLKVWEPILRRSAGLGQVDPHNNPESYEKVNRHCDVLVVGAGPAGIAAARSAAAAGAQVLLVEQSPRIGGSLNAARLDENSDRERLLRSVDDMPTLTILTNATCNGWFADNWLPIVQNNRLYKVRAREVVIAMGSQDQPAIFRNNDLPGIMLASAAQRLMRHYAVRPGSRVVVFAGDPGGWKATRDLLDAGIEVAAIVAPEDNVSARLGSVRVFSDSEIAEAHGKSHVEAVTIRTPQGVEKIDCDCLIVANGSTPAYQLPLHAGARLGFDDRSGTFSIGDLPDHMHLAGAVSGLRQLSAVERSGEIAGAKAAQAAGFCATIPPMVPDNETSPAPRLVPVHHPKGRDFVDFDEDLQVKDIENAIADGYDELELVKRYSTVGMGPSQGRHSALVTAQIVAAKTGRSVAEVGITTARPPFGPEKLGLLAGPRHSYFRHTALHRFHLEAGAEMTPVGPWWRPRYYGRDRDPDGIIADEVRLVREQVGMLDVSTLGKLEIVGPDAGAFMDRIYTMAHAGQPIGRTRYCLMLNEMGSVIDDGVAFRMRDSHFYVTATTGTADRVYADMCWWNAQWRLDVEIHNVTGAFAAINLSGPNARHVLQALDSDIDFSKEAFGYLDGRTGQVAACPARVMRIGFTGELSYELHVPQSYAASLWESLLAAGERHGVRPYGLEAQRILRLEKGHIILGQDTDALTDPLELDMEWALSKKKPFHIGKAAVELKRDLPAKRRLVGFELPAPGKVEPQESCLVLRGGSICGQVTSTCSSPTLRKRIGLAFVSPQDATPGQPIFIKTRCGKLIEARTVKLPFFDPDSKRQEV